MARARHIGAIAELLQQLPAAWWMNLASQLGTHPGGDFGAGPDATVRCRAIKCLLQFSTQGC